MYLTNEYFRCSRSFCEDQWANRSMNDVIAYLKCNVFDELVY